MSGTKKNTLSPITKAEAVELLSSALRYCQKAGIKVSAGNVSDGIVLRLDGVFYRETDKVTELYVESIGTRVPNVPISGESIGT
jgi:hypothetical protein